MASVQRNRPRTGPDAKRGATNAGASYASDETDELLEEFEPPLLGAGSGCAAGGVAGTPDVVLGGFSGFVVDVVG